MKTNLLAALSVFLILPSCSSLDVADVENPPGQPMAMQRAETRIYATPTPVSEDPTSPLANVDANGTQASIALARF